MNRITTSQENGGASWSQTNSYDRYGNRSIVGGGLTFNANNNRIATAGYSYDAVGNLTNDGAHAYTFDAENKISKVDAVSAYNYDGEGQRVRKLVGENLRFIYDIGGKQIAEFDGATGALKKEYVYGASGLVATIEPTAVNSNGTRYTTSDHLGSPRVVTNSGAGVVSRHDYKPFGEELGSGIGGRSTGIGFGVADGVRQKFTSKERDNETGLDYFLARYYSATQGRFSSIDPLMASGRVGNPQSWNRYAYVLNNPVRLIDPNGLGDKEIQDTEVQEKPPPPLPPARPMDLSNLPPVQVPTAAPQSTAPKVDVFEIGLPPVPQTGAPIPGLAFQNQVGSEDRSRQLIETTAEILVVDQYGNRLASDGQTYSVNETIQEVSRTPDVPAGEPDIGQNQPLSPNGTIRDTHTLRPNRGFSEFADDMRYVRKQTIDVADDRTGRTHTVGLFRLETTLSGLSITNCNKGCK